MIRYTLRIPSLLPNECVMADKDYSEISIDIFFNMTGNVPFDVYVQLSQDKYTMVLRKGTPVDQERIRNYFDKGATHLFILKKDRREYINATEQFIKNILKNPEANVSSIAKAVEELSEQTLIEIYEDRLFDDDSLRRARETVKSYIHLLKTDVRTLTQFLQLCRKETYTVRHSISTAIFAILLARASENVNDRIMQIVGLGGLLHDLGMGALPDIDELDRKLTPDEWIEVKKHPSLGRQATESVKSFPEEVTLIIEQHHENFDGSGYPKGLRGEAIYFPARIVTIADCFSALTTRRGGRSLFSPGEALEVLNQEKHKFDPQLLRAFEGMLNPAKKKKAS